MKERYIKETKPQQYVYTIMVPVMLAPIIAAKGIEMKNYFLMAISALGIVVMVMNHMKYSKRLKTKDNYILKITEKGLVDNPFFGQERFISWSNIKVLSADKFMGAKRLVVELEDPETFVSNNKLRFFERIALKMLKAPYRINLVAGDLSVEEAIQMIENYEK